MSSCLREVKTVETFKSRESGDMVMLTRGLVYSDWTGRNLVFGKHGLLHVREVVAPGGSTVVSHFFLL